MSTRTEAQIIAHCKKALKTSDRSSWEVADDYEELSRLPGWTQQRIADEFGVSRQSVCQFLACVAFCPLGSNRPKFWEVYREVKGGSKKTEPLETRFDLFNESKAVFEWLCQRREQWPEEFRSDFFVTIRTCLDQMEGEQDAARRFAYDPAEVD